MATPRKTASGTWRVQIEVRGRRDAATCPTKREAVEWAARRKAEMLADSGGRAGEGKTLADALRRYAEEVSPHKRGERTEVIRLRAFVGQHLFPALVLLSDLTPAHLAAWRDERLRVNSRGSVLRDMTTVSGVLEVARREWQWIGANPLADVRRPAQPAHRERIIQPHEVRRMLRSLDWSMHRPVRSVTQAVGHCFVLALQTGMRAGELCGLAWADVGKDTVRLHAGRTKTGKAREVSLTLTAQRTIERLRGFDEAMAFGGLRTQTLDALFRKCRARAGLEGFTFHDARHTAATNLARRLDVLDLCKMFGWAATTRALTYYNPTGSQIAARLNAGAAPTPRSR